MKWLLAFCLALTFFGFIDDRYRGWDDTNQYQLESQTWRNGSTPPSPLISQELEWLGTQGPTHYPPLVAFLWAPFSLTQIRYMQALLMAFAFMAMVFFYSKKMRVSSTQY